MKNSELKNFLEKSIEVADIGEREFSVAVYKNVKKIEEHLEIISKLVAPSADYQQLQEKINAIYLEHCDKGEKEMPVTKKENLPDGREVERFVVSSKVQQDAIEKKLTKLKAQNKEIFDIQEKKYQKYAEELNRECDIDFIKVSEANLPKTITPRQMFLLDFMVDFK